MGEQGDGLHAGSFSAGSGRRRIVKLNTPPSSPCAQQRVPRLAAERLEISHRRAVRGQHAEPVAWLPAPAGPGSPATREAGMSCPSHRGRSLASSPNSPSRPRLRKRGPRDVASAGAEPLEQAPGRRRNRTREGYNGSGSTSAAPRPRSPMLGPAGGIAWGGPAALDPRRLCRHHPHHGRMVEAAETESGGTPASGSASPAPSARRPAW